MSSQYYDYQLTLDKIIRRAASLYPDTEIVYAPPNGQVIRSNYANEWDRIQRLGSVLEELGGVKPGEPGKFGSRVAVLDWNTIRHYELYFGIPMYGAVLHTVNVLLAPEDIIYTLLQAQDEVLFINEDFIPPSQGSGITREDHKEGGYNERKDRTWRGKLRWSRGLLV